MHIKRWLPLLLLGALATTIGYHLLWGAQTKPAPPFSRGPFQESTQELLEGPVLKADHSLASTSTHDEWPGLAAGPDHRVAIAWVGFDDETDWLRVATGRVGPDGNLQDVGTNTVAGPGALVMPAAAFDAQGKLWLVWCERQGEAFDLFARCFAENGWREPIRLTDDPGPDSRPCLAADDRGNVWLAWQTFRQGSLDVLAARLTENGLVDVSPVTSHPGSDWSPALAVGPDGTLHVGWDTYRNGSYDVYVRSRKAGHWGEEIAVAATPRREAHASLALGPNGDLWVGYDVGEEDWGRHVRLHSVRSIEVRCLRDGRVGRLEQPFAMPFRLAPDPKEEWPQLAFDTSGRLWVGFMRFAKLKPKPPKGKQNAARVATQKTRGMFFLYATSFDGTQWAPPVALGASSGRGHDRLRLATLSSGLPYAMWTSDDRKLPYDEIGIIGDVHSARLADSLPAKRVQLNAQDFQPPAVTAPPADPLHGADLGTRNATIWFYEEWSLDNPSYKGNPFDVVARVMFSHADSDETLTTAMFYAGDDTWKFRFTGTRLGRWQFETASTDSELDDHRGTITVRSNPNAGINGFLTHKGNRFAIQVGDDARLKAYRFNVYMNRNQYTGTIIGLPDEMDEFQEYFDDAKRHGFDTVFMHVANNWFRHGTLKYSEHDSQNPDPRTFEILEKAITAAHRQGCRVHIWAWGDESRKWTPIGVGGINGPADRRLQRYIAARLGPLPGWSMGYGFDLHEWTTGPQLDDWSNYLHDHMGWDHLLSARGHRLPDRANNINSYGGFGRGVQLTTTSHGPKDYQEVAEDLKSDPDQPHFYEERHSYLRDGFQLDMDGTRRLLWWQTMAGGMGGFYGFYPDSPYPYPKPEQMRCVRDFWKGRFQLDMVQADQLTNGLCLKTPDNTTYVFYKENTNVIRADLSAAAGPMQALAVDTTQEYREIDLGSFQPGKQTVKLPVMSDWAVVLGRHDR